VRREALVWAVRFRGQRLEAAYVSLLNWIGTF
jgi:hypothetical protein